MISATILTSFIQFHFYLYLLKKAKHIQTHKIPSTHTYRDENYWKYPIKFLKFKRHVFLISAKVCWVSDSLWIRLYLWKVFVSSTLAADSLPYIVPRSLKTSKKLIKFVYYSEKEIFFSSFLMNICRIWYAVGRLWYWRSMNDSIDRTDLLI